MMDGIFWLALGIFMGLAAVASEQAKDRMFKKGARKQDDE
jgi:hypothetical protein